MAHEYWGPTTRLFYRHIYKTVQGRFYKSYLIIFRINFARIQKTLNSKHHESQSLRRIQESDIPSTSDMQSTFILRDLRSTFDILGGIILSRKNRMWKGSTKF